MIKVTKKDKARQQEAKKTGVSIAKLKKEQIEKQWQKMFIG